MHIYNASMRLLPFSWFSMKLGMINSFLIVCFTMVQKYSVREKKLHNSHKKYDLMAIKQFFFLLILKKKCVTINTREEMFQ